jgi:hypothetical protein
VPASSEGGGVPGTRGISGQRDYGAREDEGCTGMGTTKGQYELRSLLGLCTYLLQQANRWIC